MVSREFQSLGITQLPKHRKYEGAAFLVGSARCVWDDLEKVGKMPRGDVMTLNDMTMHYPGHVTHAYSNHADQLPKWVAARRLTYNTDICLHSYMPYEGVTHWPWPGHGTSALCAIYTLLALGYSHVTLCGVPLDNTGHYFDPPWKTTNFEKEVPNGKNPKPDQIKWWQSAKENIFNGRVSSMSGRTRQLLGG